MTAAHRVGLALMLGVFLAFSIGAAQADSLAGTMTGQAVQNTGATATTSLTGSGTAGHFGTQTLAGTFTVDYTALRTSGRLILTAANGDQLQADLTGIADTAPGTSATGTTVSHLSGLLTITGGTGQYLNWIGSAPFHGVARPDGSVTLSFHGFIADGMHSILF